jgi:hypothetical protein
MKTMILHYPKNQILSLMVIFSIFLGINTIGTGQNKWINGVAASGNKERKATMASVQPDKAVRVPASETAALAPVTTITSTAGGGNWNSTGTWVGGVVPSASSDVIIAGPVNVNVAATCLSLTVNAGKNLTINSTQSLSVGSGWITNNGTITLSAGTSGTSTLLITAGNVTNNPGATINAKANFTRFSFSSANAQTLTNNGTITSPVTSFEVANSNVFGLSLAGSNGFNVVRANLFYGTVVNSNKITLGTGGNSSATVQRGEVSNIYPAGAFAVAPVFNVGSRGISLLYDNSTVAYSTGYEVPPSLTVDYVTVFNAADVTLNTDLTISAELNFSGGTDTPTLRIDTHTLTIGGVINYNVAGSLAGGVSSNLVMNATNTINEIAGGLNNFTINANTTLAGAVTVNGTLTLTNGMLISGSNLTMASGSTISRSGGSLFSAPVFSGTVNLIYTGVAAINTGKELPVTGTVINNLTTNTGGVTQYAEGSGSTRLFTEGFPDLTNWTGNKGGSSGQFNTVASANAGGTSPEAEFTGATSHGNTTYYIYTGPINTTGYSIIDVSFMTETDGYYTPNVTSYLKLQSATTTGGPWHDVWSNTYTDELSAQTIAIPNYSTDVGSNMYFRFAFIGDYFALDNWYFDNFFVDGENTTPLASTATVNGILNLTNGTYSIGPNNSLVLNDGISGSNSIVGSATSNLTVGGNTANIILPPVTTGLNNFTITRPLGAKLSSALTLNGAGTVSGLLDCDTWVISGPGTFTLSSGGTLKTANPDGITSSGSTGSIQVAGARSFSAGANYEYDGSGVQATGNGLPSTVNNFTVGGTSDLTLGAALLTISGVLQVNSGARLSVPSAGQLTVGGTTTLGGAECLVLKSDNGGTASFIDNGISGSGTARVERYLTTDTWHYLSSPISNGLAGIFLNDYLRTSDPTTANGWGSWIQLITTPLEVMRGYACWKPSSNTSAEAFTGNLNTGNQSISMNRNPADPWAGWHLVGNPYPSSIDLASAGITWNYFEPTAYFWNGSVYLAYPTTGGYGTHSRYAPPEQGFYVHIASTYSGNTTLAMTNVARVHNSQPFLKDSLEIKNALLLTAQGNANSYFDEITVYFTPDATSGYDPGYDAFKLDGISEAPQLYTRIGSTDVVCNSLPFDQKNMVIPMGFSCGLPGSYSLVASNLGSFDVVVSIHLEDLKLNVTQDLRTNPVYNFTYDVADNSNRFVLHFDNPTVGVAGTNNIQPVQIYSYGNAIYVQSQDGRLMEGTVFVYNLIGQELFHKSFSGQTLNRIIPNVVEGYYLVRIVTEAGTYNGKVYLKN